MTPGLPSTATPRGAEGPVFRPEHHGVIGFFPDNDETPGQCRMLEEKLETGSSYDHEITSYHRLWDPSYMLGSKWDRA